MVDILATALSGLNASRERALANANNLANINTPGYKAQRVDTGTGPAGVGTQADRVSINQDMGSLVSTGNPLDLAIQGEGYFAVADADGPVSYTRDGHFSLDSLGRIVNSSGLMLQPQVTIPQNADKISVAGDGTVSAVINNKNVTAGQIQLTTFSNPSGLTRQAGSILTPSGASGIPRTGAPGTNGRGTIISGYQEGSNVDMAREILSLKQEENITKANIAVIRTADEMQKDILDIKA